ASLAAGAGTSVGIASETAIGSSLAAGVGTVAGSGAATGSGATSSAGQGVGASTGIGAAPTPVAARTAGIGQSTGISTTVAAGTSLWGAVGVAGGGSAAMAVSGDASTTATGIATGSCTVTAAGRSAVSAAGIAAGTSTAIASSVDPTTAWEDAIYQWMLTGSGLSPEQVIWASAGNGGPSPSGLYISMRVIDVDQVSDDWLIPRRVGGSIVHHVRGTRHPMLELRCFAGESTGVRRAELVLARVMASVMLPSVAKALRAGDVGVGTAGKVRVMPGVRSGLLDPFAMVEVQLHIKIDVSEVGGEFRSAGVTTPGPVEQVVEKP
ncbi:MAG TPA: hypothetical protein VFD36_16755, partial [Kofleriaceae bacterium]|nr:hypothetical protein [Kofleriaceae bacterium]